MVRKLKVKETTKIDKEIKLMKIRAKLDENYKIHPLYGSYFNLAMALEYFTETQPIFEPAFSTRVEGFIKCLYDIMSDIHKYYVIDVTLSMQVYQNVYSDIIKRIRKSKEHKELEARGYTPEALGISPEMYKYFNVIDTVDVYIKDFINSKDILNARDRELMFDTLYMNKIEYTSNFIQDIIKEIDRMLDVDKDEIVRKWNSK